MHIHNVKAIVYSLLGAFVLVANASYSRATANLPAGSEDRWQASDNGFGIGDIQVRHDTFIASGESWRGTDLGSSPGLYVGYHARDNLGHTKTFLQFDLAQIEGVAVKRVALRMYLKFATYSDQYPKLPVDLHFASGRWDEASVTWNDPPSYEPRAIATNQVDARVDEWVEWPIPPHEIERWLDTQGDRSLGLALIAGDNPGLHVRNFPSKEFDSSAFRPHLRVEYYVPRLQLHLTSSTAPTVVPGNLITYTIGVANIGELDVTGVMVSGDIPTHTALTAIGPGTLGPKLVQREPRLVWGLNSLRVGETARISYTVQVNAAVGPTSPPSPTETATNTPTPTPEPTPTPTPRLVDLAFLDGPHTVPGTVGVETDPVFGLVFEPGVTNATGQGRPMLAQLGYGPDGGDPEESLEGWLFETAGYVERGDPRFDWYKAGLVPHHAGEFDVVYRFSLDDGKTWVYADLDGSTNGFDPEEAGTLVVADVEPVEIRRQPGPRPDRPRTPATSHALVQPELPVIVNCADVFSDQTREKPERRCLIHGAQQVFLPILKYEQSGRADADGVMTWRPTLVGLSEMSLIHVSPGMTALTGAVALELQD